MSIWPALEWTGEVATVEPFAFRVTRLQAIGGNGAIEQYLNYCVDRYARNFFDRIDGKNLGELYPEPNPP